jgi:predicted glutamine amidotransferase
LLGYLGPPDGSSEEWFLRSDRALLAQADHDPDHLQDDGWGIAWYGKPESDVIVRKGIRGAFRPEERPAFVAASRAARGPVIVGHLRHASNPLKLPPTQLIALENSQPFSHAGSVFAHNGAIYLPTETRTRLGGLSDRVQGVNDSEILFWLLTRWAEELDNPVEAYAQTVRDLWEVWQQNGRPPSGPYGGLNIIWTRAPNELWAFCHWRGEHGTGLFATETPYYEMTYRRVGNAVVVASEPFDTQSGKWSKIPNGTYVHVEGSDGHVSLVTGAIPLELETFRT